MVIGMEKRVLAQLEKCYAVAPLYYEGSLHILVAAEKKDRCILFDGDGNEKATVWEGPGGVMTMVQIPGKDGQFLATHRFYSPNDGKEAGIVSAVPDGKGGWEIRSLVPLPFVHRFDILSSGGEKYLIACTIKSGHQYKDDWSMPGKVYGARLPEDISAYHEGNPLQLEVIKDGMLKNHGYCKVEKEGNEAALICSENGIFLFYPPKTPDGQWEIHQLLDTPASDAVMIDLDGDGEDELFVLSPFHGSEISIYRKSEEGYRKVYAYPEQAEFLHAIWGGKINGKATVVAGYRRGAKRLLAFTWDENKQGYMFHTLDEDCGPANVYGYSYHGKDRLVCANRETDEVAMYIF
ncbi:hypothetical protein D3Z45_00600 [Lachnospiraceae bacterium]|nr:hypothetical protein [Lachnospiraceae bacterium]